MVKGRVLMPCGNCGEIESMVPVEMVVGGKRGSTKLCRMCTDSLKRVVSYFGMDMYYDHHTGWVELTEEGHA